MALPLPQLDTRTAQQLVDEAKRMIPRYCPEWTDHNVSDPGVTLIELFAWMIEAMLYQLNRVPEKVYLALLSLLGVTLRPPEAAHAQLTFRLAAPAVQPLTIPEGCAVAARGPAGASEVVFHTTDARTLVPARGIAVLTSPDGQRYRACPLPDPTGQAVFGVTPRPGESFYLVYAADAGDLSEHVLALTIDCRRAEGTGVDPTDPPLTWEAYSKHDQWVRLAVERDTTLALNQPGVIELILPADLKRIQRSAPDRSETWEGFWVRCRYNPSPIGDAFRYRDSPVLRAIQTATVGILAPASHAALIADEILGYSTGEAGQCFTVAHGPLLPPASADEAHLGVAVRAPDGTLTAWEERASFRHTGPDDPHVVIDRVSGEVSFGPAIREASGRLHQMGAIPPRGSAILYRRYRTGGGAAGNVAAGTLTVLQGAVPGIDRVTNRRPAVGGRDAENVEEAKQRAPARLARTRAVTAEDFVFLAKEAAPDQVGRATCIEPPLDDLLDEPPTILVVVVPALAEAQERLGEADLTPDDDLLACVRDYLQERRLLTTRVAVRAPVVLEVDIGAKLLLQPRADHVAVRRAAFRALNALLHPLTGGPDGAGWPFDRAPEAWEVAQALAQVAGVARVIPGSVTLRSAGQPLAALGAGRGALCIAGDLNAITLTYA